MVRTAGTVTVLAVGLVANAAGCAGWRGGPDPDHEGIGVGASAGAIVVTAEELHGAMGPVLRALQGKVPNMKVDQAPGRCPAITFRGPKELGGTNYPQVYLDGTRASNTCLLETVQASDVERVEIYPQGVTSRPGYGTSNQGLILLFSRRT